MLLHQFNIGFPHIDLDLPSSLLPSASIAKNKQTNKPTCIFFSPMRATCSFISSFLIWSREYYVRLQAPSLYRWPGPLGFILDLTLVSPLNRSVRGDEIKNHITFTSILKSKSPYRMSYQTKQALVLLISSFTVSTEKNFGEVHCVYEEIFVVLSHIFLYSTLISYCSSTLIRFRSYYPLHFIKCSQKYR